MAEPTPLVSASANLRVSLDRLESILTEAADPLPELGRLGDPARLDFLFRVELATILRAGPKAEIVPERLLTHARRAAAAGILPLATPPALRRTLRRLESWVIEAGAWDPSRPLWWSPLPELSPTEELWQRAGGLAEALPKDRLAEAFGDSRRRWLDLPSLVPASLIGEVFSQLEGVFADGALSLERAGVGAGGQLSSRRSDSVLYLTGLEKELVANAPAMATLAQWCLAHLGDRLAKAGVGTIYPPQNVMLARYPAPSGGYHPHLDNPGGERDNGRTLTFVLYLNAPDQACSGGEIAVWAPDSSTAEAPTAVVPAVGGSAVLFDARTVAHQVRPLAAGSARWAMTLWFSDSMQSPLTLPVPTPSVTELLLPIEDPPVAPGKVLFHDLESGEISAYNAPPDRPRVGIVCTVYRGGAGLDVWCEHHLSQGFDHLVLIFDHLEEPSEAADAERLAARYSPELLSVWSGSATAARWASLGPGRASIERYTRSGSACWAVAARQTLNAWVALEAARGDELGGAPLDWLLHLDGDELFYLEGAGCGGATLQQHFAAADAAGFRLLRYANHELLDRGQNRRPRFKRNPHLAAARLGAGGWPALVRHLAMAQTDPRPYFTGYFNGKAAIAVAHGRAAAGVHGWQVEGDGEHAAPFLAGPSVLHCHFADAAAFRRKYLAAEAAEEPDVPLFEPSPVEVATFERIRELRRGGADEAALERGLDRLHATLTTFTPSDVDLLEDAGLIFKPDIDSIPG